MSFDSYRRAALAYDAAREAEREEERKKKEAQLNLYKDIMQKQGRGGGGGDDYWDWEIKRKQAELYDILVKEAKQRLHDPEGYARRMAQLEPEKWEKVKVADAIPALPEEERNKLLEAIRGGKKPFTNEDLEKIYGVPEKYEYRYKPPITDYEKTEAGAREKWEVEKEKAREQREAEIAKARIQAEAQRDVTGLLKAQREVGLEFIYDQYGKAGEDKKIIVPTWAKEIWAKYDPVITGKQLTEERFEQMAKELKVEKEIHGFIADAKARKYTLPTDLLEGILNKKPEALEEMKKIKRKWEEEDKKTGATKGGSLQPGGGKYFPRVGLS